MDETKILILLNMIFASLCAAGAVMAKSKRLTAFAVAVAVFDVCVVVVING